MPTDHPLRPRVEKSASSGIAFLLRAQVKEGAFVGATPRAIARIDLPFDGSQEFNRRATEVRIDYVQHALSAMLAYRDTR
ncbi:MAG: hypothetical protein ACC661_02065 [Verrucomicrobiales bacterium]